MLIRHITSTKNLSYFLNIYTHRYKRHQRQKDIIEFRNKIYNIAAKILFIYFFYIKFFYINNIK